MPTDVLLGILGFWFTIHICNPRTYETELSPARSAMDHDRVCSWMKTMSFITKHKILREFIIFVNEKFRNYLQRNDSKTNHKYNATFCVIKHCHQVVDTMGTYFR